MGQKVNPLGHLTDRPGQLASARGAVSGLSWSLGERMSLVLVGLSVLLGIYLIYALLKPEKF